MRGTIGVAVGFLAMGLFIFIYVCLCEWYCRRQTARQVKFMKELAAEPALKKEEKHR